MPEKQSFSRRDAMKFGAITAGTAAITAGQPVIAAAASDKHPFGYCFNTSTIRGQALPLDEQIDVVIEAGYNGIEPWIRDIKAFQDNGGSLKDQAKKLADNNIKVASAIGFAKWIVDDDDERTAGLETAKHDMGLVRELGGDHIAAPPVGATDIEDFNLFNAAERYHALLEVGRNEGITPQGELWGFSKTLSRLGELAFVAAECNHPDACVLPDVYHIYKGGSGFAGLKMLNGKQIKCFHVNDYPDDPPRATISDADRVHVGDGVAPVVEILQMIYDAGSRAMLSLELFNRDYWKQDPLEVAKTGLAKVKAAVAQVKRR